MAAQCHLAANHPRICLVAERWCPAGDMAFGCSTGARAPWTVEHQMDAAAGGGVDQTYYFWTEAAPLDQ